MNRADREYFADVIRQEIKAQFMRMTIETLTSSEVSKAEAARILGVTVGTIHNWVKSGRLKETKSGKISRESLIECLNFLRNKKSQKSS